MINNLFLLSLITDLFLLSLINDNDNKDQKINDKDQ